MAPVEPGLNLPPMHTDVLEQQPGIVRTAVTPLIHKRRWRIAVISAGHENGQYAIDTVAVTFLEPRSTWPIRVARVNKELRPRPGRKPRPMGKLFRAQGFVVRQNCLALGTGQMPIPLIEFVQARLRKLEEAGELEETPGLVTSFRGLLGQAGVEVEIYEFFADRVLYGYVTEFRRRGYERPQLPQLGLSYTLREGGVAPSTFERLYEGGSRTKHQRSVIAQARTEGLSLSRGLLSSLGAPDFYRM